MKYSKVLFVFAAAVLVIAGILLFKVRNNSTSTSQSLQTENSSSNIVIGKKAVSVGNDVCAEFPKSWVESVIGMSVIKTEVFNTNIIHVCNYFVKENGFVSIHHETYNVENQKKGLLVLERKLTQDSRIKMEHFVVWQENSIINNIYLVLGPSEYLTVSRSSTTVIDNEKNIEMAAKVAQRVLNGENIVNAVPPQKTVEVPLPAETDIVRSFFNVIGEHKPSDAVSMMSQSVTRDDSSKQAWAVQFNAFKTMQIKNVEPSMQADWTNTLHSYKVTLNVEMKPEAVRAVIPNYGWDNGENVRWINLEKTGDKWTIGGIATSP